MKKADKNDSMIIIIIRFGEWLNLGSEGEFVELNGGGKVLFVLGDCLVKCFLQLAEGLHLFLFSAP